MSINQQDTSSYRHLTGIESLSVSEIEYLLNKGDCYRKLIDNKGFIEKTLTNTSIANLFFENSTRTRISFELAEKRLGAIVVNFSASNSSVAKGESLLDTVRNIVAMGVEMVVIRHQSTGVPHFLAKETDAHIVNAGDGTHEHPTQALLDALTLRRHFGNLSGLRVAIIGDILHSRVARSNALLLNKLGIKIRFCGPPVLLPDSFADLGVEISYSLDETLFWADAVMMLRIQQERQDANILPSLADYITQYQVNETRLSKLSKKIAVLHPGPINQGVELTNEVVNSSQSLIFEQVTNGLAIRMAVLDYLKNGN